MSGFLVSEGYKVEAVTRGESRTGAIAVGFALGFGLLTCVKAGIRTKTTWKRSRSAKIYIAMVWGEMIVSIIFGMLGWLNLEGVIGPSFWLYFCMCTCWSLQVQLLLQIIINRVSVIMYDECKAKQIKWGVAALITAINIAVYCIWIPARLQISERFVYINDIWDRAEKVIYAICDGGLNFYFLYLVKKTLLSQGMLKYKPLFDFNACAVVCSLSMDVMIIGAMSIKNNFVYVLFQSIAYIVKLNIELTMADLIAKITLSPHLDGFLVYDDFAPQQNLRQGLGNPRSVEKNSDYGSEKQACQMIHRDILSFETQPNGATSNPPSQVTTIAFESAVTPSIAAHAP